MSKMDKLLADVKERKDKRRQEAIRNITGITLTFIAQSVAWVMLWSYLVMIVAGVTFHEYGIGKAIGIGPSIVYGVVLVILIHRFKRYEEIEEDEDEDEEMIHHHGE